MSRNLGNGRRWTAEEDNDLWLSWPTEQPVKQIARRLDRSVVACYSRAKALGLAAKFVAPRTGIAQLRYVTPEVPPARINRDDEHVERCLAQGGFCHVVLIEGSPVHVWPGRIPA